MNSGKIWNFRESDSVETDSIDLKAYKPLGKFYEDADNISKLFGIKLHPALRPPQALVAHGHK